MLFLGIEVKKVVLYDVLYVFKFICNLFFVWVVVVKGNVVEFGFNKCCIWDENGKFCGKGLLVDKFY